MALTAKDPALIKALGAFTEAVWGVAGGTGTTTTVTLPQMKSCLAALTGGATSATSPYVDTVSGNTFTATHACADLFVYIAFGTGVHY